MRFPDPLVVMALELEAGQQFAQAGVPVLYTGVGKINAAYHLASKLTEYRLDGSATPLVLNFGTAGSPHFKTGELVWCSTFVQRDMDATMLGFEAGATPYDESPNVLTTPSLGIELPEAICGTGDSFATSHSATHFNVVDMEAYALAKVCRLAGARFASFKFISDGADGASPETWKANGALAAERFLALYRRLAA